VCPIVEAEMIKMSVLVVYASKHGATRGIAGRIAASLRTAGCKADVRPVKDAGDLAAYDAFVIGSAAYELHWRKEATEFVRRNTKVLAARPVWLFSSGPLGTEPADAKGRDLRTVTVPKEIPEFTEALHPRGHHVFFGALDPSKLTFAERSLRKLPVARAGLPEGDSATGRRSMTGQRHHPRTGNRTLSAAHPDTGPAGCLAGRGAHGAWLAPCAVAGIVLCLCYVRMPGTQLVTPRCGIKCAAGVGHAARQRSLARLGRVRRVLLHHGAPRVPRPGHGPRPGP
jgi:menaquinone-dependent protoporphyrinogen oxidase